MLSHKMITRENGKIGKQLRGEQQMPKTQKL